MRKATREVRAIVALAAAASYLLVAAPSVPALQPLASIGGSGTAEGQFDFPSAVATDAAGNLYVADENNNRVQQFDASGNFVRMWGWGVDDGSPSFQVCTSGCEAGSAGGGDGQFNLPVSVHLDSAGNVYVGEFNNATDRIQKFTSTGNFITKWGTTGGNAESQFSNPWGIATDTQGNVYVADDNFNRIQKFTANGGFLRMWGWGVDDGTSAFQICTSGCGPGLQGSGDGEFTLPSDVAIDVQGTVWVLDEINSRVQKFTSEGTFLGKWGANGSGDPQGFAIGPDGNFYVADSDNDRVQQFAPNGNFVRMWGWGVQDGSDAFQICTSGCQPGKSGGGAGQFATPSKVATDCRANIYVSDSFNNRIQKFGEPGLPPPPCLPLTPKAPPNTSPPDTKITKAKIDKKQGKARFRFSASGPNPATGFECKLNLPKRKRHHSESRRLGPGRVAFRKVKFRPCSSPKTYKHLRPGRYMFFVRAIDVAGPDPTPAKRRFRTTG